MLLTLRDRPQKESAPSGNQYESSKNGSMDYANTQAALAGQDAYSDDDIPF